MFKIVILVTLSLLCVVYTQSDEGCKYSRRYTRVKRGRYPGPPIRFYNRPPITFPIKGVYSYTPPPFMQDDEPPYPGSRPYKVSKRPTNEVLGDDDINNLVKNLSKQDLDKIIEFASEKDKHFQKGKDVDYEYNRPLKRENLQRPTYKGNFDTKYQAEKPYEMEFQKYVNYVTEADHKKYVLQDDRRNPHQIDAGPNQVSFYGPQTNRQSPFKVYTSQDDEPPPLKSFNPNSNGPFQFKAYGSQDVSVHNDNPTNQIVTYPQETNDYSSPSSSDLGDIDFTETNEEEKLPPPTNMRQEDFDVSYTNNVPTVVKAGSDSYQVENFGDLPLMDYNSKLHSVSSYNVPHYTVTKSQSVSSPPAPPSFASSQSFSSSSMGLKPSPAAASIKAPPFEPAPPPSAAREQSDAHLKAIKIWSHKSKGVAYTLHDDGTLTPEFPRPKYGK